MNEESQRLDEDESRKKNWKRWGPYLSERQWATVREDYSEQGDTWSYFPHDHARSRTYRWGEDGLLGITDRECRLLLRFGAMERTGCHLEGTSLRTHGPGRQSWRGLQGMLLLPRLFSYPFLPQGAL